MDTFKQIVREFWIPFILAAAWTVFEFYNVQYDRSIGGGVKNFSGAFFLISWATGQVVRVSRQARTDRGLQNVENRIIKLTDNLSVASDRFINTVTGGDSFAYIAMYRVGSLKFQPYVTHYGDCPLSNLHIRICDLNKFRKNLSREGLQNSENNATFGELAPKMASPLNIVINSAVGRQDWNVFFSARNGFWTQLIRGCQIGSEWKFAFIVFRLVGGAREEVKVSVPDGFPIIGEAEFDNARRDSPISE